MKAGPTLYLHTSPHLFDLAASAQNWYLLQASAVRRRCLLQHGRFAHLPHFQCRCAGDLANLYWAMSQIGDYMTDLVAPAKVETISEVQM